MKRKLPEATSRHPGCRVLFALFAAMLLFFAACIRKENTGESIPAEEELPEEETAPWEAEEKNADGLRIRVVDSYYQYANDYSWEDLFTIMPIISQMTPDRGDLAPAVILVRLSQSQDPLLFSGYLLPESDVFRCEVFTMDSGYVYKLLSFEDEIFYSPGEKAFYLRNAGEKYVYTPHVFLAEDADLSDWPEDTERLPVHDITYERVSIDTLSSFLLDLSEKGGAE